MASAQNELRSNHGSTAEERARQSQRDFEWIALDFSWRPVQDE